MGEERRASTSLQDTAVLDSGLGAGLDSTGSATNRLEGLDDLHGLVVTDLTENDVLSIEPAGDDSGDEELRAVAIGTRRHRC